MGINCIPFIRDERQLCKDKLYERGKKGFLRKTSWKLHQLEWKLCIGRECIAGMSSLWMSWVCEATNKNSSDVVSLHMVWHLHSTWLQDRPDANYKVWVHSPLLPFHWVFVAVSSARAMLQLWRTWPFRALFLPFLCRVGFLGICFIDWVVFFLIDEHYCGVLSKLDVFAGCERCAHVQAFYLSSIHQMVLDCLLLVLGMGTWWLLNTFD